MISVLIETRNQEHPLAVTLVSLVPGAVEGLVAEVVVIDRGSNDRTEEVAEAAGCRFTVNPPLAGLLSGLRGSWILAVEPGARLCNGWIEATGEHMAASAEPARFVPERSWSLRHVSETLPLIGTRRRGLANGLLMRTDQAIARAGNGTGLCGLAQAVATRRLSARIIPASQFSG